MNKKLINIILLVTGIVLIIFALVFLRGDTQKRLGGTCVGIGAGLIGFSVSKLAMAHYYNNHPKEMIQTKIELKDERNEIIHNKAKAKSSDIVQWVIMAVAWITILADFPIWITLTLIGVFLLKIILEICLVVKYSSEM